MCDDVGGHFGGLIIVWRDTVFTYSKLWPFLSRLETTFYAQHVDKKVTMLKIYGPYHLC
jgi:hypothetical protein